MFGLRILPWPARWMPLPQLSVPQPPVPNLPTAPLKGLPDTITAVEQTRVAVNTLLAELRAAGLIKP